LKNLIVALSVIGWVGYARLMRAQMLNVREITTCGCGERSGGKQLTYLAQAYSVEFDSAIDRGSVNCAWDITDEQWAKTMTSKVTKPTLPVHKDERRIPNNAFLL
jgi:hypothetical protein